ncbi:MAG: DUF5989 family protein [Burkholderiales bacterium]
MGLKSFLASFWSRYRKWIIAALIVYVVVTLALVFLTRGPQSEPFIYQVF